jgi:hypothetical protein
MVKSKDILNLLEVNGKTKDQVLKYYHGVYDNTVKFHGWPTDEEWLEIVEHTIKVMLGNKDFKLTDMRVAKAIVNQLQKDS